MKIKKELLIFVGITFILIGFLLHQSYKETQNSGTEFLETAFSPVDQIFENIENPTSTRTFDQDEYTTEVLEKGGLFMHNIFNLERNIIGAISCFIAGITAIALATKDDISRFCKETLKFIFGP